MASTVFLLSSLSNINLAAIFLAIFLLEPVAVTESPSGTRNTAYITTKRSHNGQFREWGPGGMCYLKDWSVGLASDETNLIYRTDPRGLISLVQKTNRVGFVVTHDLAGLGRYIYN